jgi:hypothetical protein
MSMKWSEVTRTVKVKLGGDLEEGGKHAKGRIHCGNGIWTYVKIGHHTDMKPHEMGGCARSLRINEFQFKQLVACPLSKEEYFAIVLAKG